jgi:isoleucyl-tRNA synthetase
MKDVIPRFQTMNGNYVSRNMGWDCQGILVEVEIEKELGFKHKTEIENYGIDKFNEYCKTSVLKLKDMITDYEKRFGRFIDHSDEYFTMDPKYIESMWWSIKELYNKGLIYEDYKVVAYSTRAGTTLSTHEVRDGGYKEAEDDFVIAKFKLTNHENTYLLAYTTTPWTLPSNLLIGVKKDSNYSKVKFNNEFYIVASELVPSLFTENFEIVEEMNAEKLVNNPYEPILPYFSSKSEEGAFRVVYAEHATTTDGTGLVHLAPYGEEDSEILKSEKIKL